MNWMNSWFADGVVQGPAVGLLTFEQWNRLVSEAERVQQDPELAKQATMESQNRAVAKTFLKQWLGRYPVHDPDSIWADIERTLRPYAAEYLRKPAIPRFYNLLDVTPSDASPSRSQLWHQDQEDRRIAKAFIYLSDVTPEAGPLYYAKGTQSDGPYAAARKRIQIYLEPVTNWARATDDAVAKVVPRDQWHVGLGPTGSMLLVDTAGYHRGGHATGARRLSAVWMWTSANDRNGSRLQGFK